MASVTPDNDNRAAQDGVYSPEAIKAREEAVDDVHQQESTDQGEADERQRDVSNQEENPNPPPDINSSYTGKNALKGSKNASSFLKRKGPLLAIGGGIGVGSIALLVLVVPSLLLFHLLANLFGTYDPSATALTKVTQIVLLNKLGSNDATTGVCNVVKIACRFKTPSNALLRELNDNGIVALDKDGAPLKLDANSKWPNVRPSSYRVTSFHSDTGEELVIAAKDLKGALQTNTTFRLAFNKVVKRLGNRAFSRFSPAFAKIIEKFKLNLRDPLASDTSGNTGTKKTISDRISELIHPEKATADATEEAAKEAASIVSETSLRVNKLLTTVAKASKGSGVVLAMALSCMADEIPGMIEKTMTSIQQSSIITAGAPVVTSMSAVQAGDSTAQTASDLGTAWTQTDGNGNSALNSAGINYALYGNKDTTTDPTYQNVRPAAFGSSLAALDLADKVANNPVSASTCALLMNPLSGAAVAAGINAAFIGSTSIETFGISFAVNAIGGLTASYLINQFAGGISDAIAGAVSPALSGAAQPTIDKLGQPYQTFGNVVSSAVGLISSNNGAQTFGQAATTKTIQAYAKDIKSQQVADANYDRATLSPFDATSRYTFLGSIVDQFLPYYGSLSTLGGSLSAVAGIIPMSFTSLLHLSSANAAEDPANLYTGACPDNSKLNTTSGDTLAADIYCDPVYATSVPDNWDPSSTESSMEGMGAISDDTGEAITHDDALSKTFTEATTVGNVSLTAGYDDWLTTCTDIENATQCTGGDPTEDTYSIYTAAKTVNDMADADLTSSSNSNSSNSTSSATSAFDSTNTDTYNYTASAVAQTASAVASIFSSSFNLLKAYNASVVASFSHSSSTLDTLARFTLW